MSSASLLFTDSSLSSRFPRVLSSPDLVPTVSLPHALSLIDSLLHAPPCASRSFLPLANGMHLFGFALPLVTTLSSSSSSSSSSSRCCLSADVEGKSSSDEDASVRALSLWIVDSVLPHAREIAREYDEMHHHDSSSISKSFPSSVYAFVIHYAVEDGDRSLGPHMDDAQVTVNICLRRGEDTQGADVCFYGEDVLIGNAEVDPESGPQVTAPSIPTYALVHGPDAIHRVTSLVSGFRTNLVLWFQFGEENADFYDWYIEHVASIRAKRQSMMMMSTDENVTNIARLKEEMVSDSAEHSMKNTSM